MDNLSKNIRPDGPKVFMRYFALVIALIYVALGVWFLASAQGAFTIPHVHVLPLGVVFTAYGLFRAYRIYKKQFMPKT